MGWADFIVPAVSTVADIVGGGGGGGGGASDFGPGESPGVIDTLGNVGRRVGESVSNFGPGENPAGIDTLGSGVGDFAGKLFGGIGNEFAKSPLSSLSKTLGLGLTGMNFANQYKTSQALNEASRATKQGMATAQAAAAPAASFGTETLNRARAGQLTAPMEAQVQGWMQKAKADMRARFAQMGQGNSSNIAQEDARIEQMAQEMRGTMLQQQEQTGLAGIQTGVSAATGGANIGAQQQQFLSRLLEGANAQLARLGAQS